MHKSYAVKMKNSRIRARKSQFFFLFWPQFDHFSQYIVRLQVKRAIVIFILTKIIQFPGFLINCTKFGKPGTVPLVPLNGENLKLTMVSLTGILIADNSASEVKKSCITSNSASLYKINNHPGHTNKLRQLPELLMTAILIDKPYIIIV